MVITAVALDPAYVPSPEYVAVSVLAPLLNAPAGTEMLAAPAVTACCALYAPLVRAMVPVGVGSPLTPAIVMETASDWLLVIVEDAVVMVTVDGLFTAAVTITDVEPVAPLYVDELELFGVKVAVSVSVPVASAPAGIANVAEPPLRVVEAEV
jgi:uncharacterized membrane protein